MVFIELHEAQLFNLLASFFGRERVVPHMSVWSVCGGALPEGLRRPSEDLAVWAKSNKCLFTIIDGDDNPKMVVEFFSGFEKAIDATEEAHQRILPPLLAAAGIRYITISDEEFSELLDPRGSLDLFSLLEEKVSA